MNTVAKNLARTLETRVLPSWAHERTCPEPTERESDQELDLYDRERDASRSIDDEGK